MKNFLIQNWFKISLLIVMILGIFTYIQSSSLEREKKDYLANSIKCQQEGRQLFEMEKKEILTGQFYIDPEFRFSDELNTCLYNGGLIEGGYYSSAFIKDVYTNKELVGYSSFREKGKEDYISGDKAKYFELRLKYFPE